MKLLTIIKKLIVLDYEKLAKSVYRLVLSDPIYFNNDEILSLIYYEYEQTKDNRLAYLHQEINKNGVLITSKLIKGRMNKWN